jgi:hypothetical protein
MKLRFASLDEVIACFKAKPLDFTPGDIKSAPRRARYLSKKGWLRIGNWELARNLDVPH